MEQEQKTKPVWSKRIGRVEAAIWPAENSSTGERFFNTKFQVQYKDGNDYVDTAYYSAWDIFNLIRCAMDALAFIRKQELPSREERVAA